MSLLLLFSSLTEWLKSCHLQAKNSLENEKQKTMLFFNNLEWCSGEFNFEKQQKTKINFLFWSSFGSPESEKKLAKFILGNFLPPGSSFSWSNFFNLKMKINVNRACQCFCFFLSFLFHSILFLPFYAKVEFILARNSNKKHFFFLVVL